MGYSKEYIKSVKCLGPCLAHDKCSVNLFSLLLLALQAESTQGTAVSVSK